MDRLLKLIVWSILSVGWAIAGVGAVAIITMAFTVFGFSLMVWLGPIGALLLLVLIATGARQSQRRRGRTVLLHVAQAVRLNLPLGAMRKAGAADGRGATARRLDMLGALLASGASLGESLPVAVPELPPQAVARIAVAERLGRLPQLLPSLLTDARQRDLAVNPQTTFAASYGMVILIAMLLILGGLGVIIAPKFERIFEHFDTAMPPITQWVFHFSGMYTVLLLIVAVPMAALLAGWSLRACFLPREDVAGWLSPVLDPVVWVLPVAGGIARARGLAEAWSVLAEAVRTGLPLPEAIDAAAELRINFVLRQRLRRWARLIREGEPPDVAARRCALPASDCGLIATALRGGELADTLDLIACCHAHRHSRAAALLTAAATPLIVLVLAVVVAVITIGLFMPLVTLIETTASYSFGDLR